MSAVLTLLFYFHDVCWNITSIAIKILTELDGGSKNLQLKSHTSIFCNCHAGLTTYAELIGTEVNFEIRFAKQENFFL